jgi:geranylgeranyl diphosphate synthase type I
MDFLTSYKSTIVDHLTSFLSAKEAQLTQVNGWSQDVIPRIRSFATSGKMIRGSLAMYAHSLFSSQPSTHLLDVAAAFELFQSGFLIHDDIMDQDALRRGKPAIYKQYEKMAEDKQGKEATHFGVSMGINAADLCFFLGYELLGKASDADNAIVQQISGEFANVVLAQMQDVAAGHLPTALTKQDILSVYRYKTARYSFSLPLKAGAALAGALHTHIKTLDLLGEHMGILFQVRDDELNSTGSSDVTGKSTGSDAKNRKQTMATVSTSGDVKKIKEDLVDSSHLLIASLPISDSQKKDLAALLFFCHNREA